MKESLKLEADAFDARVQERLDHGLIPDLRNVQPNDWFFNNPWRRPLFVDMVFGDYFRFVDRHLDKNSRVLEIGSGLGHLSLELARKGHHVTGLELSPVSVATANEYKDKNTFTDDWGSLHYINADFLSYDFSEKFDAIYFCLTLHHFSELDAVLERCATLLKDHGKIIVVEPARDLFSKRNAGIVALLRLLLSASGNWYQQLERPAGVEDMDNYVDDCLDEYREAKDKEEKEQSPNDNESYAKDMLNALDQYFQKEKLEYGNSLVPRMVGGLRGQSEEQVMQMALALKLFDDYGNKTGILDPGVIYYVGTPK